MRRIFHYRAGIWDPRFIRITDGVSTRCPALRYQVGRKSGGFIAARQQSAAIVPCSFDIDASIEEAGKLV